MSASAVPSRRCSISYSVVTTECFVLCNALLCFQIWIIIFLCLYFCLFYKHRNFPNPYTVPRKLYCFSKVYTVVVAKTLCVVCACVYTQCLKEAENNKGLMIHRETKLPWQYRSMHL